MELPIREPFNRLLINIELVTPAGIALKSELFILGIVLRRGWPVLAAYLGPIVLYDLVLGFLNMLKAAAARSDELGVGTGFVVVRLGEGVEVRIGKFVGFNLTIEIQVPLCDPIGLALE